MHIILGKTRETGREGRKDFPHVLFSLKGE